ncbi:MAG TPA: ABC transporter ATP-binding protein [Polyangiaceae bacterium]|nr:ABC transporter ATP-binding protein [Polyangiaceae bacterium]
MSQELLAVRELHAGYGEAVVLEDVSFSVPSGGSLAILGRNGTGKTTLLTSLMGLTRCFRGSIRCRGLELRSRSSFERARAGLGWVPQERAVFPSLTVQEHLDAVARPGPWHRERIFGLFPALAARRSNLGHQLSGGEQQMLAIGRALVTNPVLLLLDEPMEGLAPVVVQELTRVLRQLRAESSMAILLVEQHARLALQLSEQVLVLERGRIVHQGPSAELAADAELQRRLLALA